MVHLLRYFAPPGALDHVLLQGFLSEKGQIGKNTEPEQAFWRLLATIGALKRREIGL
jgi:hypothetical protein